MRITFFILLYEILDIVGGVSSLLYIVHKLLNFKKTLILLDLRLFSDIISIDVF